MARLILEWISRVCVDQTMPAFLLRYAEGR